MTPLRIRLAAAVLGAGLVLAAPAAAFAGPLRPTGPTSSVAPTDRTIDSVRARCQDAITKRLTALGQAMMLAVILVIVVGTIRLIGSHANNVFSETSSAIGG